MEELTHFLSCDWGTSSFRLKLVELPGLRVVATSTSDEGNAATFAKWQETKQPDDQRLGFYLKVLAGHVRKLEEDAGRPLTGVPVVISGMASSTVGMLELPYKPMPFAVDGADLATKLLPATADFAQPVLLISGVRTPDDVMRGEEVQLVGCGFAATDQEQLFLHPGTHAKHVTIRGGQAVALKTYMTGEFFALLSKQSILASAVEKNDDFERPEHRRAFERGVQASQTENLLHNAFLVRTNQLFDKLSKPENFYFLSGLLIGAELRSFPADFRGPVVLAGEKALVQHYEAALELLGITQRLAALTIKGAEEVTLQGQAAVLQRLREAGQLTEHKTTQG
ncbi:2-dehydro-3-deoxygalactonokinase [Hymenobacter chitinivorans]|uniref:2-dehydro-3-deoxygalactonokinase n=1 Tax=Hymenobacter chitinivorans DSM 11115 TaxID=1121954 RepID=A0A2M9BP86_9BACT|nr:2-dehydro-3-deoxygalactonokinase [Hymenobacter chitinivorans]PJJ59757.1 2-dehydro-3-deoxygalactonokinase [Hymenobacter chitinivorans DSM 11115]